MNVTVDRNTLVNILEKNKKEHREKFNKAWEVFNKKAIDWFEKRLAQLQKGKLPDTYFTLPVPEDHTDDYKQMIDMLNMHTNETIVISVNEYRNYVNDDWPWTPATTTTYASYGVRLKGK